MCKEFKPHVLVTVLMKSIFIFTTFRVLEFIPLVLSVDSCFNSCPIPDKRTEAVQ